MKVLINSWNDAKTIRKTLESVRNYDIHVFDGRYKDFPGKGWHSTDGTIEILKEFNVTYHKPVPNELQTEKRSRMFSVLKDGEYGLKLDADEVLLNKIPELKGDVVWAWTLSPIYDYPYCKPMFFKKQEGLHYKGKHHWLFKGKELVCSDQFKGIGEHTTVPVRFFNDRNGRGEERNRDKLHYIGSRDERNYKSEDDVYGPQEKTPHIHRAHKVRKDMRILKEGTSKYTYSILFSRPWAVERYFQNFDKLELPEAECVCIVDTDDTRFFHKVIGQLKRRKDRFAGIKVYMTGDPAPPEKSKVAERRRRISRNLHIILTEAQDILLGSEDDSLPPPDAYPRLIKHLEKYDFAQASIAGRWDKIIPAWKVTEGEKFTISTGEKKKGLEEIDAAGWYCMAVKTNAMRSVPINCNICMYVGPDVHQTYYMKKEGYKLVHDHDLECIHFTENEDIILKGKIVVRKWTLEDDGSWTTDKV